MYRRYGYRSIRPNLEPSSTAASKNLTQRPNLKFHQRPNLKFHHFSFSGRTFAIFQDAFLSFPVSLSINIFLRCCTSCRKNVSLLPLSVSPPVSNTIMHITTASGISEITMTKFYSINRHTHPQFISLFSTHPASFLAGGSGEGCYLVSFPCLANEEVNHSCEPKRALLLSFKKRPPRPCNFGVLLHVTPGQQRHPKGGRKPTRAEVTKISSL